MSFPPPSNNYLWIPNGLDIDTIISADQIHSKRTINKWQALYLIHLIITVPNFDKKQQNNFGYVNLASTNLKKIKNYRNILDFLVGHRIIEENSSYSTDKHFSKSYRIYWGNLHFSNYKKIQIPAKSSIYKLLEPTAEQKKTLAKLRQRYTQLINSFDGLKIDSQAAVNYLGTIKFEQTKDSAISGGYKQELSMATWRFSIESIKAGSFFFNIDKTAGRFHTNISNLKKEFRHFLSWNSEPLIGLDVRSSQPYLAQMLFSSDFWSRSTAGTRPPFSQSGRQLKTLTLSSVLSRVPRGVRAELEGMRAEILPMCQKIAATHAQQGFPSYTNLVNNADIYDHIKTKIPGIFKNSPDLQEMAKELGFKNNRDRVKSLVIKAMYSSNVPRFPDTKFSQKLYAAIFPDEMALFNYIKLSPGTGYRLLAIILQALESHIMLDIISRNISKLDPSIPIFTIHDSILTTEKHKDTVKKIMIDEFSAAVGFPPGIKEEIYSQTELEKLPLPFIESGQIEPSIIDEMDAD